MQAGLRRTPRELPCKFLYDERGAELFEEICTLDEYYPTRTELAILRDAAPEIAWLLGRDCLLIEYGSGEGVKTRVLLDRIDHAAGYVPIDISREQLLRSAAELSDRYPGLEVLPVCADYTAEYRVPAPSRSVRRRVVYFPGSTIGNFTRAGALAFLKRVAGVCGSTGALLIGVDLHKDTRLIEAAYDDARGVSAAFALNLLDRANRELDADFDLKRFAYHSFYDEVERRVDMGVVSLQAQTVHIGGEAFELARGERIRTEVSHKFTPEDFRQLAAGAGLQVRRVWTDADGLFSVQYLTPA